MSLAPLRSERDSSSNDPEADPQTVRRFSSQQCVTRILDCCLDDVFNFHPDRPDDFAAGQQSLNEVISAFERAKKNKQASRHSFPEVVKRDSLERSMFRCTCDKCKNGKAVEIEGEPYPFGKEARPKYEVCITSKDKRDIALTSIRS